MKILARQGMLVIALIALPGTLLACLWDYDTLKQERARFPSTLELITGKFLRHSPEFYQWRIKDRIKKLQTDPANLGWHDDLAVAYEKTGQHDKAIETILAKEKIKPGIYETYSNLGTFHILAGDFKKGLPFIDNALVINPDAHFGREKYQKWLVEYALAKYPNGKIQFPLQATSGVELKFRTHENFALFLWTSLGKKPFETPLEELQKGVKGVQGMMRFATHDNPLLLEALGDLLVGVESPRLDAKRLSALCYLKASYVVPGESAKLSYRNLAKLALDLQVTDPDSDHQLPLTDLESDFQKQLKEADVWFQDLRTREVNWIEKGLDPEKKFDGLYLVEPIIETTGSHGGIEKEDSGVWDSLFRDKKVLVFVFVVGILGLGVWLFRQAWKNARSNHPGKH